MLWVEEIYRKTEKEQTPRTSNAMVEEKKRGKSKKINENTRKSKQKQAGGHQKDPEGTNPGAIPQEGGHQESKGGRSCQKREKIVKT